MFKLLYNWIKYKTLPPSFLFKNRLYIERDTKTRRVTSNLGLTFRNSKWVTYARTDIHPSFKTERQIEIFVSLLALSLSIFLYYHFLLKSPVPTLNWTYPLWFLKDSLVYLFFSCTICLSLHWTTLQENFYKTWLGWVFLKPSNQAPNATSTSPKPLLVTEAKYTFVHWLLSANKNVRPAIYEQLMKLPSLSTEKFAPIVTCTSQLLFTLATLNEAATVRRSRNIGFVDQTPFFYLDLHAHTTPIVLGRQLTANVTPFLGTWAKWDLLTKSSTNPRLRTSKAPIGLFYGLNLQPNFLEAALTNAKFGTLFEDLLRFQEKHLKTTRFLYNYSFMHRKVYKNIIKLTNLKRLVSSGFYNDALFRKNIWASDFFSTLENPHSMLRNQLYLLYGNFYQQRDSGYGLFVSTKENYVTPNLYNLSHYEDAFFWLTKRLVRSISLSTQSSLVAWDPSVAKPGASTLGLKKSPLGRMAYFLQSNLFTNYFLAGELGSMAITPNVAPKLTYELNPYQSHFDLSNFDLDFLSLEHETLLLDLLTPRDAITAGAVSFYATQFQTLTSFVLLDSEINLKISTPPIADLVPFIEIQETLLRDLGTF